MDPAFEAVNDAYRVIDEYLRQGQQMARSMWLPYGEARMPGPDWGPTVERLTRVTGDVAMAWLEMFQQWSSTAAGSGSAPASPFAATPDSRSQSPYDDADGGLGFSVSVESPRPVTLSVELHPGVRPESVRVGSLACGDPSIRAIQSVALEPPDEQSAWRLRCVVPAEQPPGVYNGLILDRVSERPRGTISLCVESPRSEVGV